MNEDEFMIRASLTDMYCKSGQMREGFKDFPRFIAKGVPKAQCFMCSRHEIALSVSWSTLLITF